MILNNHESLKKMGVKNPHFSECCKNTTQTFGQVIEIQCFYMPDSA